MLDAWRLSVGTLTALRVRHPTTINRRVAGTAMLLAPLAVIPLGVLVGVVGWAGRELDLAPLALGVLMVGVLALGSRALHLDGLSDVADALTVSYDPDRSLAVMKSGTSGPAGSAAIVLVLGVQAAAFAAVICEPRGPVVAGFLVCASRAILWVTCARGVPGARRGGLAASYVGTVPVATAGIGMVALAGASGALLAWAGHDGWHGPAIVVAGLTAGGLITYRCVRRFGGVTGDVFGAAIEITLATMLLGAT